MHLAPHRRLPETHHMVLEPSIFFPCFHLASITQITITPIFLPDVEGQNNFRSASKISAYRKATLSTARGPFSAFNRLTHQENQSKCLTAQLAMQPKSPKRPRGFLAVPPSSEALSFAPKLPKSNSSQPSWILNSPITTYRKKINLSISARCVRITLPSATSRWVSRLEPCQFTNQRISSSTTLRIKSRPTRVQSTQKPLRGPQKEEHPKDPFIHKINTTAKTLNNPGIHGSQENPNVP